MIIDSLESTIIATVLAMVNTVRYSSGYSPLFSDQHLVDYSYHYDCYLNSHSQMNSYSLAMNTIGHCITVTIAILYSLYSFRIA